MCNQAHATARLEVRRTTTAATFTTAEIVSSTPTAPPASASTTGVAAEGVTTRGATHTLCACCTRNTASTGSTTGRLRATSTFQPSRATTGSARGIPTDTTGTALPHTSTTSGNHERVSHCVRSSPDIGHPAATA